MYIVLMKVDFINLLLSTKRAWSGVSTCTEFCQRVGHYTDGKFQVSEVAFQREMKLPKSYFGCPFSHLF